MVHQLNQEHDMGNAINHEAETLAEQHADLDWSCTVLRGRGDDQDSQGAAINMLRQLAQSGCTDLIRRASSAALSARHTQA